MNGEARIFISSDHSKPTKGGEYKAMSFPLCASRKHHTCFLLMASIEEKKASERECVRESVWEREREGRGRTERGREGERETRTCRTDCSSFPFLSPHAHSPRQSCDLVAPSVGPPLQRVSTEHAQMVQTVAPLHFYKLEDLVATEGIQWSRLLTLLNTNKTGIVHLKILFNTCRTEVFIHPLCKYLCL